MQAPRSLHTRPMIEIREATIGEDHPNYATSLNNLAGLLRELGRHDEAEPLYTQAIEIGKATIGEDHPDYAIHLNNLARLFIDQERWTEAEPLMAQALRILEARLPPEHPYIAGSRRSLETIRAKLP